MTHAKFHQFSSPAKLNLFLHIVGRRKDGYHELETLFQFVDHSDTLEIRATHSPEIKLLTPIEGVAEQDNLIYKAAKILQDKTKVFFSVVSGCIFSHPISFTFLMTF